MMRSEGFNGSFVMGLVLSCCLARNAMNSESQDR